MGEPLGGIVREIEEAGNASELVQDSVVSGKARQSFEEDLPGLEVGAGTVANVGRSEVEPTGRGVGALLNEGVRDLDEASPLAVVEIDAGLSFESVGVKLKIGGELFEFGGGLDVVAQAAPAFGGVYDVGVWRLERRVVAGPCVVQELASAAGLAGPESGGGTSDVKGEDMVALYKGQQLDFWCWRAGAGMEMDDCLPASRAKLMAFREAPTRYLSGVTIKVASESRMFHAMLWERFVVGVSRRSYVVGMGPRAALRRRGHHPPWGMRREMAKSSAPRAAPGWPSEIMRAGGGGSGGGPAGCKSVQRASRITAWASPGSDTWQAVSRVWLFSRRPNSVRM